MSVPYCFECEGWHAPSDPHKGMTRKADRERIARRSEARARLLAWLQPGSRVHTRIVHCSRSGMQREVTCSVAVISDGKPEIVGLDYWIAQLCDERIGKHGGIVVGGCGFDAGFQVVYNLGMLLWPNGTDVPHGTRNREPDTSGGYALKHDRW